LRKQIQWLHLSNEAAFISHFISRSASTINLKVRLPNHINAVAQVKATKEMILYIIIINFD
jgi:hypothetical protein